MTILLDANVLIALAVSDHVHHEVAEGWFARTSEGHATCPITQGALMRVLMKNGASPGDALEVLVDVTGRGGHEFWPDDVPFDQVALSQLVGHRQVTDAYLAALARRHGGSLATLDRGLAALHADVAVLLTSV